MTTQTQAEAPLIAVIEDEDHLAQALIFNLEAEGYRTHHEAEGDAALKWLTTTPEAPAAVLLDVMLPKRDGFSIVRSLREAGRYLPVMLLTARGRSEDIVQGFAAGADDYLPKPFELNVLLARLSALLRRMHWQTPATTGSNPAAEADSPSLALGDRVIDLAELQVRSPTETIHLTLMEADLLRYLLDRPNKIISRKELLENVWRVREDTDTRAIDNFIVRLRRYLEPDPANPVHLLTVRGVGYRFVV
ncbi:two component transcriptional regulator, winged helix family [Bryocella elongata]|uniref:Two component transcriptional regulator, winged helix family n=1 Tax=Bryocella elongata TaxID=863522 RepID=A0A1H5ZMR2_9BACT|nr:response regulator transcription factor [Bryocella elongata]SEG37430.1 two component transcriptional regulator, winged helix family [Bryocella elongata]